MTNATKTVLDAAIEDARNALRLAEGEMEDGAEKIERGIANARAAIAHGAYLNSQGELQAAGVLFDVACARREMARNHLAALVEIARAAEGGA